MNSSLHPRVDDDQVGGFQVPRDGPFIPSISSAAPAPEALKPQNFTSLHGVFGDFAFFLCFFLG
jgi:hypothetical protein